MRPRQAWASRGSRARVDVPRPSKLATSFFGALVALGFGITVGLAVPTLGAGSLAAPGGLLTAVGRVTGLAGTYFLLIAVLLIGRIPAVERALGQDRLVRCIAVSAPWVLILIGAHASSSPSATPRGSGPAPCTSSRS